MSFTTMAEYNTDGRMTAEQRQLFFQYLPLVGYAVKKVVGFGNPPEPLEYSDLMQLGMIGLMDAVKRFDSSRGVQFQTYALNRIRGTIQDELRKLDWVPRSVRKIEKKQEQALHEIEQQGIYGSVDEMAKRLSISTDEYRQILNRTTASMIENKIDIEDEENNIAIADTDEEKNPYWELQRSEFRTAVYSAIEQLPKREKMVLILYYYEELTFKEIARLIKLSEARVSQIHDEIMERLRNQLQEHRE
ncbi:MAG: FliA/WhiG family RNA polymerase sigma factor [Bacteroidetes bacterium]|nr:FliA/WhiG family RNA polymerase sigma factor [Bacteroidota bacterium]